jgi:hypothetical protein
VIFNNFPQRVVYMFENSSIKGNSFSLKELSLIFNNFPQRVKNNNFVPNEVLYSSEPTSRATRVARPLTNSLSSLIYFFSSYMTHFSIFNFMNYYLIILLVAHIFYTPKIIEEQGTYSITNNYLFATPNYSRTKGQ